MISGIRNFLFGKDNHNRGRNIILTGIPRSGTTLACRILSDVENQIALNEPIAGQLFHSGLAGERVVDKCMKEFRTSLLQRNMAPVRAKDGKITDNAFSESGGLRKKVISRYDVHFPKELTPNFTLILKHCAEFSLILPKLKEKYDCFAIIRNPLSVLASWNSVNLPVSRGKVAKSKILNPVFFEKLEAIKTLEEKQFFILDWYYSCYNILPNDHIILYEAIIETNGGALSVVSQKETLSNSELSSKNRNHLYDKKAVEGYLKTLLDRDGTYLNYYSKETIIEMAENLNL